MDKRISFVNLLDTSEELSSQVRTWRNYDHVRNNMFNTHIISEEEHVGYMKKLKTSMTDRQYIAFHDSKPFGVLNLHLEPEEKRVEFGYYLTDARYIDGGYGAILEYVLLDHAFLHLKLETVFCRTLSTNKKVVALHKRFGFSSTSCDEQICRQSIDRESWIVRRELIGKTIDNIFPLRDIGTLY